jgi:hypothetical protein
MRRTKEWWARLTEGDRSELCRLERAQNMSSSSSDLLPDDMRYCSNDYCSLPHLGSSLCPVCFTRLRTLLSKADAGHERR